MDDVAQPWDRPSVEHRAVQELKRYRYVDITPTTTGKLILSKINYYVQRTYWKTLENVSSVWRPFLSTFAPAAELLFKLNNV